MSRKHSNRKRDKCSIAANLDKAGLVVPGCCTEMCPESERCERQRQKRLHRFEILVGTEKHKLPIADPNRTVKEYSRPAAGKVLSCPDVLRPADVLMKTVHFLIDDIALSEMGAPWTEVYDFVFDRLRSVRQDMTIQRMGGKPCVAILELSLRFLIYTSYKLCEEPAQHFEPKINDTHVQECFNWLLGSYKLGTHPNEPEFQSLALLYNLGSAKALSYALQLPEGVRHAAPVQLAFSINRAFLERNFVRFFRLVRKLPYLQSCAIHRHLGCCQRELLRLYSQAYSSKNCRYPVELLTETFALDSTLEVTELCQRHGLVVCGDFVVFSKMSFIDQGDVTSRHTYKLVDSKLREQTIADVLHGLSWCLCTDKKAESLAITDSGKRNESY
ncbi:SAC3 domain-containing protein 1 [Polypterus senegalus]|uniref:SAC3 domain-containing protein 1 n=1 Tax=Polypterus senegalus TaxID=55291 RepID=UPI0019625BF1|nr:SAC3 domain-containing protein 1 [Polypterus senegalus]